MDSAERGLQLAKMGVVSYISMFLFGVVIGFGYELTMPNIAWNDLEFLVFLVSMPVGGLIAVTTVDYRNEDGEKKFLLPFIGASVVPVLLVIFGGLRYLIKR